MNHTFYYTDTAFPNQRFSKSFFSESEEEARISFKKFLNTLISKGRIVYETL